jgi:hypothetical protein
MAVYFLWETKIAAVFGRKEQQIIRSRRFAAAITFPALHSGGLIGVDDGYLHYLMKGYIGDPSVALAVDVKPVGHVE